MSATSSLAASPANSSAAVNIIPNEALDIAFAAADRGDANAIAQLVATYPALATVRGPFGDALLHRASLKGSMAVVDWLLGLRAPSAAGPSDANHNNDGVVVEILSCNAFGNTPLHKAARGGQEVVIRRLCAVATARGQLTVLVNRRNAQGFTALHDACLDGKTAAVAALLESAVGSIDLDLPDNAGKTALELASDKGHTPIVDLLRDAIDEADRREFGAAGEDPPRAIGTAAATATAPPSRDESLSTRHWDPTTMVGGVGERTPPLRGTESRIEKIVSVEQRMQQQAVALVLAAAKGIERDGALLEFGEAEARGEVDALARILDRYYRCTSSTEGVAVDGCEADAAAIADRLDRRVRCDGASRGTFNRLRELRRQRRLFTHEKQRLDDQRRDLIFAAKIFPCPESESVVMHACKCLDARLATLGVRLCAVDGECETIGKALISGPDCAAKTQGCPEMLLQWALVHLGAKEQPVRRGPPSQLCRDSSKDTNRGDRGAPEWSSRSTDDDNERDDEGGEEDHEEAGGPQPPSPKGMRSSSPSSTATSAPVTAAGSALPAQSPVGQPARLTSRSDQHTFRVFRNERLGVGGFGVVYRGFDDRQGREVAVKEAHLDVRDPKQEMALRAEFNVLTQVNHRHIVRVYHFNLDSQRGVAQLFLEWMPSGSVASILERRGPLSESVARSYGRQALLGLRYLHDVKHLTHRDVKPHNLLVTAQGTVKLSDFGTAKTIATSVTSSSSGTTTLMGTPQYLAPECVRLSQNRFAPSSDIWAWACTMVQMLTAQLPWAHLPPEVTGNVIALCVYLARLGDGDVVNKLELEEEERTRPSRHPVIPRHASRPLVELLTGCFHIERDRRPTAATLLAHSYFASSFEPVSSLERMLPSNDHASSSLAEIVRTTCGDDHDDGLPPSSWESASATATPPYVTTVTIS